MLGKFSLFSKSSTGKFVLQQNNKNKLQRCTKAQLFKHDIAVETLRKKFSILVDSQTANIEVIK